MFPTGASSPIRSNTAGKGIKTRATTLNGNIQCACCPQCLCLAGLRRHPAAQLGVHVYTAPCEGRGLAGCHAIPHHPQHTSHSQHVSGHMRVQYDNKLEQWHRPDLDLVDGACLQLEDQQTLLNTMAVAMQCSDAEQGPCCAATCSKGCTNTVGPHARTT
jgi:hypothetical protein